MIPGGNSRKPFGKYVVAMNKITKDRYLPTGPEMEHSAQIYDISGEKMELLYDFPTHGEPHYAAGCPAELLAPKSKKIYRLDDNKHPYAINNPSEARVERDGNEVHIYMSTIRSHFTPDNIEGVKVGDKVYDLTKESGFFEYLELVDGAKDGVAKLSEKNDVYIVSAYATDPETAKGKVIWYEKNFPNIIEDEKLILCKPKFLVYGDVLVDDSVDNLKQWSEFMANTVGKDDFHAICFAAPHNEGAEDNDFVDIRVTSWKELLDYLDMVL